MKAIFHFLKSIFLICILTILTQTGGVIYLLYKPFTYFLDRTKNFAKRIISKMLLFSIIYAGINIFITPVLAKKMGRVPLPIFTSNKIPLGPAKWYTVVMNRHYVKPLLKETAIEVARQTRMKYLGTKLCYLDGNFPFIDGFPLIPHLSHDDGEKLDLCFFYTRSNSAERLSGIPGVLGYGFCEEPKSGEEDTVAKCRSKGKWQYDIMSKLSVRKNTKYEFDQERTKYMINEFSKSPNIRKLFLEPHLKTRLGFSGNDKIRFQGCHSVRHDDHLHVQM